MHKLGKGTVTAIVLAGAGMVIHASSHREAPGITKTPKLDGTDFYMFRSYEPGRAGFVTLLANYYPLQDPAGGPNFYMLDENATYEIHVDNTGDGREDVTFQFRFQNLRKDLAVPVGDRMVPVPLINIGPIGPGADDTANLNVEETYTVSLIRGQRRSGQHDTITNATTGSTTFRKPVDRIGDKSIRENLPTVYNQYADDHIYDVTIPGCSGGGRVFVGQRREGFVINVGEALDLINTNPLGPENGETNDLAGKNITTLAVEVPIDCLVAGDPVIGGWTTSSLNVGTMPGDATPVGPGVGGGPCPSGQPATEKPEDRPGLTWVPDQTCSGWVPAGHPAARGGNQGGVQNSSPSQSSASAGAASCPSGQPSSPKPEDRPGLTWVPDQTCTGWVPSGHPNARSSAGGSGGGSGAAPVAGTQMSRLGNPLVNEVVIGLKDKDKFNASEPADDAQFLEYVTHPTMPVLIQALFGVTPPPVPRNDLVQVFLTGIPGLNQPQSVSPSEMMRLNTNIAPVAEASQNRLGVIGGDLAGFPNGRRPGDDVVDIELRVLEGILLSPNPSSFPMFTDGAITNALIAYDPLGNVTGDSSFRLFRDTFPYLRVPLSPSPKPIHQ